MRRNGTVFQNDWNRRHFPFRNIDRARGSAFLTSLIKGHLHVGLFRPIRLQHNWVMTTSFTCSTGLGDKLMPPLLPGMFRLLFARLRSEGDGERESCVSQMTTRGIKAPRGAILSPKQSAAGRKTRMSAFRGALWRQRTWRLTPSTLSQL